MSDLRFVSYTKQHAGGSVVVTVRKQPARERVKAYYKATQTSLYRLHRAINATMVGRLSVEPSGWWWSR